MASYYEKIETPNKVQKLQRTLYRKAKEDRRWRAWSLYADLCRVDVLETALKAVVENKGAAGLDGMSVDDVQANRATFLENLRKELVDKTYTPGPVKRVWIPKGDGKLRPLGIPNVKDRIVQKALKILLEPIFEADFDDGSYAYRPEREAKQAVEAIRGHLRTGKYGVIDADLSGYFDSIDHEMLLSLVARRVSDGAILRLVKLFLKAPVVDRNEKIDDNDQGTPQGGVLSPLLANLFLNSLDHGVNDNTRLGAKLVRYADDFVILCPVWKMAEIYERLKKYLKAKKLVLNEKKTRILDFRKESFKFLGFEISWTRSIRTGRFYEHVEPSLKAQTELRNKIRTVLSFRTRHLSCKERIEEVNQKVRGWFNYYRLLHCSKVFGFQMEWVRRRLAKWLWLKYDRTHNRNKFFTKDRLHGQYGLVSPPLTSAWNR